MGKELFSSPATLDAGLLRYFTPEQLNALGAVTIGLVGAGGLGSNVALMLARSGFKCFVIADHDCVEASNLNRQGFFPDDIGESKVKALSWHLLRLEPKIQITAHEKAVTRSNAPGLFVDCPVVIEAVDDPAVKMMLYEVFAPVKDLYVTASGLAGSGGSEAPLMVSRRLRHNVVAVGDFRSGVENGKPPLAPRVMQAAALQADAVLSFVLAKAE